MPKFIYTDDPITETEWDRILGLPLHDGLVKLLALLRSKNNEPIPVRELPDFFYGSHPEQLNQRFSEMKEPYRVGAQENKAWHGVDYRKRAIKLYKVKEPERRPKPPEKPKNPRKGPAVYFNPSSESNPKHAGFIQLGFSGVRDREQPWMPAASMRIKASISVSPLGGFIHLRPTREEMDKIIEYLMQIREKIPEQQEGGDGLYS